jgi:pentatricopeptide repeat protein
MKKTYLCGKLHRFKKCWYLVEKLRLSGWKPDLALQRQIDEKI